MSHNIPLPRHRYVYVVPHFVLQPAALYGDHHPPIPAVWYGVSVQPGRAMGCHVLLENGATVVDLPLHALRSTPQATFKSWQIDDAVMWDGFGWSGEAWEPPYLSGLSCTILDRDHKPTMLRGTLWFAVDHLNDGYSLEPAQHKHLWVVALDTGVFVMVPQDQFLVTESSFTEHDGVPRIRRQSQLWCAES
jgi:hypothetical protein